MALYTQLSLIATPGKPYSFSAKTPAAGKGAGSFTELSVSALPGAIHSFKAVHEGQFTELSVIALPGGRHVFLPKEFVKPTPPVIPPVPVGGGGGLIFRKGRDYKHDDIERLRKLRLRKKILKDDEELLEMIATMLPFL